MLVLLFCVLLLFVFLHVCVLKTMDYSKAFFSHS